MSETTSKRGGGGSRGRGGRSDTHARHTSDDASGNGSGSGGAAANSHSVGRGGGKAPPPPPAATPMLQSSCVLLVQPTAEKSSRTYLDHDTVTAALKHMITTFENCYQSKIQREKKQQKSKRKGGKPVDGDGDEDSESYETSDLFDFIDNFFEVTILVFEEIGKERKAAYIPHNKEWIKDQLYDYLLAEANLAENDDDDKGGKGKNHAARGQGHADNPNRQHDPSASTRGGHRGRGSGREGRGRN